MNPALDETRTRAANSAAKCPDHMVSCCLNNTVESEKADETHINIHILVDFHSVFLNVLFTFFSLFLFLSLSIYPGREDNGSNGLADFLRPKVLWPRKLSSSQLQYKEMLVVRPASIQVLRSLPIFGTLTLLFKSDSGSSYEHFCHKTFKTFFFQLYCTFFTK
jgi:hypothetical protein